jgi:hypothetical protein
MFLTADLKRYHVYHVDVYQGKNASNIDIHPSIRSLPTTQKAVLNAMIALEMHENKNHGARHVSLDNRYQCPELAHVLREKFHILSTGTVRRNRKGWNTEMFNLKKDEGRGTFKRAYDPHNHVACIQWIDSKPVNFVTTDTQNWSVGEVRQQVGSTKQIVKCPEAIIKYQKEMGGVDKGDQFCAHGGGFANKAHFKKWYKKTLFGLFDIKLLNAFAVFFKMCCEIRQLRGDTRLLPLKHHEVLMYCAEAMITFQDKNAPPTPEVVRDQRKRRKSRKEMCGG